MELNVKNITDNQNKGTVAVSDSVFGCNFNEDLAHQAVVAWAAGSRQGTKAQKNRSAVSGGGAKPWRQKGTGRARAGTSRSPIWRKGGVTFAAKPRDYTKKMNKKMYRAAIRTILSELNRQERLIVVDSLSVTEPKTKHFVKIMQTLNVHNALFISNEADMNLHLSSNNIPNIAVIGSTEISAPALVHFDHIVITEQTLKELNEAVA